MIYAKKGLIIVVMLCFFILPVKVFAAELSNNYRLEIEEQKSFIKSPINTDFESLKGEDLLVLQIIEGHEVLDREKKYLLAQQSRTRYYVLNPAEKNKGFTQIFDGPGHQYSKFVSPLFNGWCIVDGKINKDFKPERGELFWFNAITGDRGSIIQKGSSKEFIFKEYLIFFSNKGLNKYHLKSGELSLIPIKSENLRVVAPNSIVKDNLVFYTEKGLYRYHLESGELFYIPIELKAYQVISSDEIFAEIAGANESSLIELDILTFNIKRIAKIPSALNVTKTRLPARFIGKADKDGVFIVNEYSLWFKPNNQEWRNVVKDVPIVGVLMGSVPHLPVVYLGNGKFAVTKSIEKEVVSTKKNDADDYQPPDYLSVTMLIDGYTGKIIQENKPTVYKQNPKQKIPDHWLTEKQLMKRKEYLRSWKIYNKMSSKLTVQFNEKNKIELEEKDIVACSASNKFAVIYKKRWRSDRDDDANCLNFKVLEKQTGKSRDFRINTSDLGIDATTKVLYVLKCDWHMIAGSEFDAEKLEKSRHNFNHLYSLNYDYSRNDPKVWDPVLWGTYYGDKWIRPMGHWGSLWQHKTIRCLKTVP